MLPIANPHPTGQANPITLRAAAILLPASAWDAVPLEIPIIAFDQLTLYFTYTRGGAAGAFDFYLEHSPYYADLAGVEDWFQMSLYAAGIMAAGTDITSNIQRELLSYTATGAAAEMFVYGPIALSRTVERIRVLARESGNAGAPGELHIVGVANG